MDLLAQPPFRADAKAVAHDQHADHQFRIDRRSAYGTVERLQLPPQPVEFDKPINRSQQVLFRHMSFERELVEQRVLFDLPLPHHRLPPAVEICENYAIIASNTAVFQQYRKQEAARVASSRTPKMDGEGSGMGLRSRRWRHGAYSTAYPSLCSPRTPHEPGLRSGERVPPISLALR